MGLFDSIKNAISGGGADDEVYYEAVALEISSGNIRPGLWVKALAETGYQEHKAKARYIQLRVEVLKGEVRQFRTELVNEERSRRQLLEAEQHHIESDAVPAYRRGDYPQAFRGFAVLAQKGHAWAQNHLAWMLENGQGVACDLGAAIDWYEKAAEQNDKDAQFSLGRICLHRLRSYESSQRWFAMAEKNGHPDAQRMKKQAAEFVKAEKNLRK